MTSLGLGILALFAYLSYWVTEYLIERKKQNKTFFKKKEVKPKMIELVKSDGLYYLREGGLVMRDTYTTDLEEAELFFKAMTEQGGLGCPVVLKSKPSCKES